MKIAKKIIISDMLVRQLAKIVGNSANWRKSWGILPIGEVTVGEKRNWRQDFTPSNSIESKAIS